MNEHEWLASALTENERLSSDDASEMLAWLAGEGIKRVPFQNTRDGRLASARQLRLLAVATVRALTPRPMTRSEAQGLADVESVIEGAGLLRDGGPFWWVLSSDLATRLGAWWGVLSPPALRPVADLLLEVFGNPFRPVTFSPAWRTPDVLSLALAAYEERAGSACDECDDGVVMREDVTYGIERAACPRRRGSGTTDDATLDPQRLLVLADALEEAGCRPDVCPGCGDGGTQPLTGGRTSTCPHCAVPGHRRELHPLLAHLRSPGSHVRGCWAVDLVLGRA